MKTETKKFFLYARKSTDEPHRQIRSIDDQLVEMRQVAGDRGIHIVDVLVEKQTARRVGRPVFNNMIERIERGEATGIIAWHADRLARNPIDGARLIELLDCGTVTEIGFKDSWVENTSHGKFMLAIAFGMSKYHSDNFGDGIKRLQRRKVNDGLWPQRPPLGYRFEPDTGGIAPDDERAPLIRRTFEIYATGGYSLPRLRDVVNDLGLRNRPRLGGQGAGPLSLSQYERILKNPIYYGVMRFNGEHYQGKHKPIISKRLFDEAQEILACRSKPNIRGPVACLYRGMFRCGECGASITSEIQKGHEYLRCTKKLRPCSQRYVRIEEVTRQVSEYVQRFALPDDVARRMLALLDQERRRSTRHSQGMVDGLRMRLKGVDDQAQRLLSLYLDQGISLEEYRAQKHHLVDQHRELDEKLVKIQTTGTSWLEPAEAFIRAAQSTVFWENLKTDEQKRDFLKKAGSNLTIKDRTISLVPRDAWKTVVVSARGPSGSGGAAAPNPAPCGEPDPNQQVCPEWEQVRTFFTDNRAHAA